MFANIYSCFPPQIVISATSMTGADDPDLSITLTKSTATLISPDLLYIICLYHTLSGCIGKVVASHAAVARLILAAVALIYTVHEELRGYCP